MAPACMRQNVQPQGFKKGVTDGVPSERVVARKSRVNGASQETGVNKCRSLNDEMKAQQFFLVMWCGGGER